MNLKLRTDLGVYPDNLHQLIHNHPSRDNVKVVARLIDYIDGKIPGHEEVKLYEGHPARRQLYQIRDLLEEIYNHSALDLADYRKQLSIDLQNAVAWPETPATPMQLRAFAASIRKAWDLPRSAEETLALGRLALTLQRYLFAQAAV
ncbi:MAG TPA: hypothetical protein DF383_04895 [Deltaproteobacteria bacterium]|nr:hypothetical protein [Deltaproteobacteria bacterium]